MENFTHRRKESWSPRTITRSWILASYATPCLPPSLASADTQNEMTRPQAAHISAAPPRGLLPTHPLLLASSCSSEPQGFPTSKALCTSSASIRSYFKLALPQRGFPGPRVPCFTHYPQLPQVVVFVYFLFSSSHILGSLVYMFVDCLPYLSCEP